MNIRTVLRNFWILPFASFILGYFFIYYYYPYDRVVVPNVTAKKLQDSIRILGEKKLNLVLLKEIEDSDLSEGVILSQDPISGTPVKTNQNVFVVVTKKPELIKTPDFINSKQNEINKQLSSFNEKPSYNWINSFYPKNICIAQSPEPNSNLDDKMILYFSQGESEFFVIPNLIGYSVEQVFNALDNDKVFLDIFYNNIKLNLENSLDYKVVNQKPMPGSIIDLKKKLYLQVQVR